MLLTAKSDVRNRDSFRPNRFHHFFRLIRWNYLIFQSLKEDYRTREPLRKVDWRTFEVNFPARRIWSKQTIQIARLKLVSVTRNCFSITNSKMTCTCLESLTKS